MKLQPSFLSLTLEARVLVYKHAFEDGLRPFVVEGRWSAGSPAMGLLGTNRQISAEALPEAYRAVRLPMEPRSARRWLTHAAAARIPLLREVTVPLDLHNWRYYLGLTAEGGLGFLFDAFASLRLLRFDIVGPYNPRVFVYPAAYCRQTMAGKDRPSKPTDAILGMDLFTGIERLVFSGQWVNPEWVAYMEEKWGYAVKKQMTLPPEPGSRMPWMPRPRERKYVEMVHSGWRREYDWLCLVQPLLWGGVTMTGAFGMMEEPFGYNKDETCLTQRRELLARLLEKKMEGCLAVLPKEDDDDRRPRSGPVLRLAFHLMTAATRQRYTFVCWKYC